MAWPTPATISTDSAQFVLLVPNNVEIRRALRGAVYSTFREWHWLKSDGGLTPEEVCQAIRDRLGPLPFTVV